MRDIISGRHGGSASFSHHSQRSWGHWYQLQAAFTVWAGAPPRTRRASAMLVGSFVRAERI